ncbi:uncharacterized protein LOC143840394 [Paroedura picta]|uniref:uncharacterized protein LOC143840394 n=1 Tax=Paroedura picta TaxID=143630 RepID=UPI0040578E62
MALWAARPTEGIAQIQIRWFPYSVELSSSHKKRLHVCEHQHSYCYSYSCGSQLHTCKGKIGRSFFFALEILEDISLLGLQLWYWNFVLALDSVSPVPDFSLLLGHSRLRLGL